MEKENFNKMYLLQCFVRRRIGPLSGLLHTPARKFHDLQAVRERMLSAEALYRIAKLYVIKAEIRG